MDQQESGSLPCAGTWVLSANLEFCHWQYGRLSMRQMSEQPVRIAFCFLSEWRHFRFGMPTSQQGIINFIKTFALLCNCKLFASDTSMFNIKKRSAFANNVVKVDCYEENYTLKFQMKFLTDTFIMVWIVLRQQWFRWWLDAKQPTSYCLNHRTSGLPTHTCVTRLLWVESCIASVLSDVSEIDLPPTAT